MKGLLTKDLMLLRNQWKTLATILFIGIVLAVTSGPESTIAYLPMISGMLVLGTLSYDEMDHSYSYLFTLPASRSTYVKEKYLFGLAVVLLAMVIGITACVVIMMISSESPLADRNEIIATAGVIFSLLMLLLAIEIPLRLKFGIEKGRIALYVMFGILAIGAVLLSRFCPDELLSEAGTLLVSKGLAILGGTAVASLMLLYLSSVLSTRILSEKEF